MGKLMFAQLFRGGAPVRPRPFVLIVAALGCLLFTEPRALAQDIFEIQVYEYPTVPKHKWNLETHINFIARGAKEFEGRVAPTDRAFHLTFELTRGLTEHFELAGYLMLAARPGVGFEYAGARIRPRFRLPRAWHLPVDVSISTEVAFPQPQYDANSATLEIRPIIEKTLKRVRLSFNPVVGRALRGPDTDEGFDFEPGAKFAYFLTRKVNVGLEYYGSTGAIADPLPIGQQQHLFFPSLDVYFSENLMMNFGIGFSATGVNEKLIPKMRIGYRF
jgi:hypothetical protein